MPAENDPAEPNALMQSLQLTCSLTPKSTLPSTRLVIIWLKRWFGRSLIEPPREFEPVIGAEDGLGAGEADSADADEDVGLGVGDGVGVQPSEQLPVGVGEGDGDCADTGDDCTTSS